MATSCLECSVPIAAKARGRPPRYCSRACQAKAYRARHAGTSGRAGRGDRATTSPYSDVAQYASRLADDLARAGRRLAAMVAAGGPLKPDAVDQAHRLVDELTELANQQPRDETSAVTKTVEAVNPPPVHDLPPDEPPAQPAAPVLPAGDATTTPTTAADHRPVALPKIRRNADFDLVKQADGRYVVLVDGEPVGVARRAYEGAGRRAVWEAVDSQGLRRRCYGTGATPQGNARTREAAAVGLLSDLLLQQENQRQKRRRRS